MDSGCLSLLLVLTNIVNVRIYSLQGAVGNLSKDTDQIGSLDRRVDPHSYLGSEQTSGCGLGQLRNSLSE
jgi:hypothetical protein